MDFPCHDARRKFRRLRHLREKNAQRPLDEHARKWKFAIHANAVHSRKLERGPARHAAALHHDDLRCQRLGEGPFQRARKTCRQFFELVAGVKFQSAHDSILSGVFRF